MSNIIPIAITAINIITDDIIFKCVTPLFDMYENAIDNINVVIKTSTNHFVFECSFSLFFFIYVLFSFLY